MDGQAKIFQENLSHLLRQRGKSQKEVADFIGVSPQTFNTWCQGISFPRLKKLQLLADYFELSIPELLRPMTHPTSFSPTPLEREMIEKFRSMSDTEQNMILRMLGIEEKGDAENVC